MTKKIVPMLQEDVLSRMKKKLKTQCSCYVLITCSVPSSDGRMDVEMNFDGDEDLAALLVDNAAQAFSARTLRKESQ